MKYFIVCLTSVCILGCSPSLVIGIFGGSIVVGKTIENNNKRNMVKPVPKKEPVVEKVPEVIVVLLADDDGHIGKIEVSTNAGSQVIDQPNQYTVVKDVNKVPAKPEVASDEMIKTVYAGLLSAQPIPPVSFTLYFESATTFIDQESAMLIPKIIDAARERKPAEINIVGHADRAGNDAFNIKLSLERAKAVHNILRLESIDDAVFEVSSHGENDPLILTEDGVAEAKNRRVEVIVR